MREEQRERERGKKSYPSRPKNVGQNFSRDEKKLVLERKWRGTSKRIRSRLSANVPLCA